MEQKTFTELYTETKLPLLRFLIPRVKSSSDVEDLTQEIYRKLFEQMHRRSVIRDPERYLFGIAKRELARFYRRKAVRQSAEAPLSEELTDEAPQPDESWYIKARAAEAWAVVQKEPLLSYQAFTLYYGFDMPTAEIASELGISEEAVRQRISRTRRRIRLALEPTEPTN